MELWYLFVVEFIHVFTSLSAYNVDIEIPLIYFGHKEDQFGYSAEILKHAGAHSLLVGAPNKPRESNLTGVLYSCPVRLPNSQSNANSGVCNDIPPTMTYARRYAATLYKTDGLILVCSPLRLHALDHDLTPGGCEVLFPNLTKYKDINIRGRTNETRAKGMYGFSLTSNSHDPSKVVLGGPNACESDGGLATMDVMSTGPEYFNENEKCDNFFTGKYFGFTVESLPFKKTNYYVVGEPGFANENGMVGMIEVVDVSSGSTSMERKKQFTGKQLGGGFGQSLCVMDTDGDNVYDIIVGAPLEYVNLTSRFEILENVGRIYVFFGDSMNIIRDESKNPVSGDPLRFSGFGTALSAIGDINDDNFQDLAVGAPFEDEMRGAVYIFNGCRRECVKNWAYSQKIRARTIHELLQGFGSYISRSPEDIDDNDFNDFAVGAYRSGSAVIMRSRPVISIEPEIRFHQNPVPLNSSKLKCAVENDYPCLEVEVCFNMSGKGVSSGSYINFILYGDVFMVTPRIQLNGNESFITINDFLVKKNESSCTTLTGKVSVVGPMFFLNLHKPMVFGVNLSLSGKVLKSEVAPILRGRTVVSQTNNVTFKSSCSKDENCQPYFTGKLNISESQYIEKLEMYKLDLSLKNHGDPSTNTTIELFIDKSLKMTYFETHDNSEKLKCKHSSETLIECKIETDPFYQHQFVNGTIDFILDPKTSGTKGYFDIKMDVRYTASGQEVSKKVSVSSVYVRRISAVSIGGVPSEEQREVDIDVSSLTHKVTFSVENKGPSAISGLLLQMGVPRTFQTVAILNDMYFNKDNCYLVNSPNIIWNDVEEGHTQTDSDVKSDNLESNDIRCSNPTVQCRLLECKVTPLDVEKLDSFSLEVNISDKIVNMLERVKVLNYIISAKVNLSEDSEFKGQLKVENSETVLTLVPKEFKFESTPLDLGVVIGGSVGGFTFLCLLGIALWKAGFFERKKRKEVDEYKRRTAIMKRQSRMSKLSAVSRK